MIEENVEAGSAHSTLAPQSLSYRWGAWVARRHWVVLGLWLVLLAGCGAAFPHLEKSLVAPGYQVPHSESDKVAHLLQTKFKGAGAEQDVIVFHSAKLKASDPAYRQMVDKVVTAAKAQKGVVSVTNPLDAGSDGLVSADQHAAMAPLGLNGNASQLSSRSKDLLKLVNDSAKGQDVDVYLTGFSPVSNDLTTVENEDVDRAESVGMPVAIIVLLIALGAVVAALIPLVLAMLGLVATFGALTLLTPFTTFDSFLVSIVTMIGIGIGIDYALFIVARFREELPAREGEDKRATIERAVGSALTTSGRTVLFSGVIVMISLMSLFIVNSHVFQEIAIGAALSVVCTLLAAWTVLPALLGALGTRVNKGSLPARWQPAEINHSGEGGKQSAWARWAHLVMGRPWMALFGVAALLVIMSPALGLKTGINLGLPALKDQSSGKAGAVLTQSFSPGAMSPVEIVVSHAGGGKLNQSDLDLVAQLTKKGSADSRVAQVQSVTQLLGQNGGEVTPQALDAAAADPAKAAALSEVANVRNGSDTAVVSLITKVPVDSTEATHLVRDLRDKIIPEASAHSTATVRVGGASAEFLDLSKETTDKTPWVFILVLGLSFLYLMVVFRSILLPLQAVVMNLLATGASFGLVAWIFEKGHLSKLFDFTSTGFVQVYLPLSVFALLFGLSMDYEVFLIRRIQEEYTRSGDTRTAVADGVAHTARPIAAAAAIMAAVFGCFVLADVLELKQFGIALAAAVVLDATLIRLLVIPAVMRLFGKANWWLPGWLGKILPNLRLD